jgi:hypothetical protein
MGLKESQCKSTILKLLQVDRTSWYHPLSKGLNDAWIVLQLDLRIIGQSLASPFRARPSSDLVRVRSTVEVDHREQVALGPHKFSLALAKISLAFLFCAEYYY